MQFFRASGSRACTRRQGLCGVVCSSGHESQAPTDEAMVAKGPSNSIEFNHLKTLDGNGLSNSIRKASAACSPLQFILEDLAMPARQPAHAFRRAVCVPFHPAAAATCTRAGLERQVRLLLLDGLAHPRCSDVQTMAVILTQQGLRASLVHPSKPPASVSLFARSLSESPFLVITSDDADDVVVVDGALRDHLQVAPSTPAYQRTLAAAIPDLFIGTLARLHELVTSMAMAIAQNFTIQGVDTPPWRRTAALLSRWTAANDRQAELAAQRRWQPLMQLRPQQEQQQQAIAAVVGDNRGLNVDTCGKVISRGSLLTALTAAASGARNDFVAVGCCGTTQQHGKAGEREPQSRPRVAAAAAASPQSPAAAPDDEKHGFTLPEGQVHGREDGTLRHRPFVVVRGFEVEGGGEVRARPARGRETCGAGGVKPGWLACLCRKQGGATPGSSTGSDGEVMGASPSSVFRSE